MRLFSRLFGKTRATASPPETQAAQLHIPTVQFDQSRVTTAVEAEIRATLQAVPEIGAVEFAVVHNAALRSVSAGRNLALLSEALARCGFTKSRASEVALLVHNRASSLMDRERQASLGIVEAIWVHSGAPCFINSKRPSPEDQRRDANHLAINGKRYVIAEGVMVRGQQIWPGQEPGCKCIARALVAGFD